MGIFSSLKQKYDTYVKKAKRKRGRRKKKKRQQLGDARSYTKSIVTFILVNAVVWVYLTYILAFMDKTAIAEQLSIVVVKVIIYTILSYLIKALVENVFKFNFISKIEENPYINETVVIETPTSDTTETTDEEPSDATNSDNEVTDTDTCAG